jgi:hypothetical protein
MPIDHITKLYAAFSSLLDMTQLVDQDDYDKLNTICAHLKNLLSIEVFENANEEEDDELEIVQVECDEESTTSSANASYSALTDDLVDESNNDEVKEVTVIKHDRCIVDKRRLTTALPSDYTDYDGYKHYFV